MTNKKNYLFLLLVPLLLSCSSEVLKPVSYGWPIEDVLKVDGNGIVNVDRYSTKINVKHIFFLETKDSTNIEGKEIRVIRDNAGYYYFTSPGFQNVYVFEPEEGAMALENKILIDKNGLTSPAMNQKNPYIEIIDGNKKYLLNKDGIKR